MTADLTNTGAVSRSRHRAGLCGGPGLGRGAPEQLKGFDKVTLAPGQTAQVSIPLGPQSFSVWDSTDQAWVEEPGQYRIMVGDSSANLPLRRRSRSVEGNGRAVRSARQPNMLRTEGRAGRQRISAVPSGPGPHGRLGPGHRAPVR